LGGVDAPSGTGSGIGKVPTKAGAAPEASGDGVAGDAAGALGCGRP